MMKPPNVRSQTANWRVANRFCSAQPEDPMANPHVNTKSRTLVNAQPQAIRLVLSDGTERIARPWSVVVLPLFASDGSPLEVLLSEFVFSQVMISDDAA
jgi:hypothetical protein